MFVCNLQYSNFRNFESLDLNFSQGFVVLCGENGSGKTNFLEGIFLGGNFRKFPDTKPPQLFRQGHDFLKINLGYRANEEEYLQEVFGQKRERGISWILKRNRQKIPRPKFIGALPVVSFLPQDLSLLSRSPGDRRRFLNSASSAVAAVYRNNLSQYAQSLHQRTQVLEKIKTDGRGADELEVWNEKLAEFGSSITSERQKFCDFVNLSLPQQLLQISPKLQGTRLVYRPAGSASRVEFLEKLRSRFRHDLALGGTTVGPHRDDFALYLNGEPVMGFVSRGELRSLTLSLKFLEKQYLEQNLGIPPIMILDDVFSEFDEFHQGRLIDFLESLQQVFLTTAQLAEIKKHLPARSQVYSIAEGRVSNLGS